MAGSAAGTTEQSNSVELISHEEQSNPVEPISHEELPDPVESLSLVYHASFKYVLIPERIDDAPDERCFEGEEGKFSQVLRDYFTGPHSLNEKQKEEVSKIWNIEDKRQLETALQFGSSYEIVPISLPSKRNEWQAVNAYIDSVGRVKEHGTNARASRICGTDVKGDCFISRTYDDEMEFKRIDFSLSDYKQFLENPPAPDGRSMKDYQSTQALLKQIQGGSTSNDISTHPDAAKGGSGLTVAELHCDACRKTSKETEIKLMKCKCGKAHYCGKDCQRADWKFHKRICSAM